MQEDLFETPSYKLHRRDGETTSRQAAQSFNVSRMEKIVLAAIDSFGKHGCISDDVLEILPTLGYSTVTARYKQLKEKGLVVVDDTKRKGKSGRYQLVMWSKESYQNESANV
jgi:predicted transcriptional regulator